MKNLKDAQTILYATLDGHEWSIKYLASNKQYKRITKHCSSALGAITLAYRLSIIDGDEFDLLYEKFNILYDCYNALID